MKLLVMGSGGVGGYFGGRLAAAGNDVTFVARGAHLAAIQKDGLILDSQIGNATIKPAKVTQDPATAGVPEVIMFATKMTDAEGAAAQLKSVVGRKHHHHHLPERRRGTRDRQARAAGRARRTGSRPHRVAHLEARRDRAAQSLRAPRIR